MSLQLRHDFFSSEPLQKVDIYAKKQKMFNYYSFCIYIYINFYILRKTMKLH